MKITNTLRVATYMVAIFMVSLTACKKVDNFFFSKYHLQLDESPINGTVLYNINGTGFRTLTTKDTVIEVKDNTTIVFQAIPNPGYQFADWGTLIPDFGSNNTTAPIKLTKNFVIKPTFTQTKSEYTIALGTITKVGTGNGQIEYSTDNRVAWATLTTTPVTLPAGTSILFKATTTTGFFWGWSGDIGGFDENPPAITLNKDMVISASFGDYEKTNVALKPSATNGSISWSNSGAPGTFTVLRTAPPYDSVQTGNIIHFEATPDPYYKIATWSISPGSFIETSTDGLTQVSATITQEATITANFQKIQYTVTVNTPANGTITYSQAEGGTYTTIPSDKWTVDAGTTLYFKATPNTSASPYYRFGQFTDNIQDAPTTISGIDATSSILVTKNVTVGANFIRQFKIDVPVVTGGSLLVNATKYAIDPGKQPATSTGGATTIYIDKDTAITAKATPTNNTSDDPNVGGTYYRFANWVAPFAHSTGKAENGINTSNAITPTSDLTIPAPTFQQQYKLTINSLTEGYFHTGTTIFATTAGNQPAAGTAGTRLQSDLSRLEGYFDNNTIITITTAPASNKKIRFTSTGNSVNSKITPFTITQNTTLTGASSDLMFTDLFDENAEYTMTSGYCSGNGGSFARAYISPEGYDQLGNDGKIKFKIIGNQLAAISITNTSMGGTYSGIWDNFNTTAFPVASTTTGSTLTYTFNTSVAIGNTPAGTSVTLKLKCIGDGNGRLEVTFTENTPSTGGVISFIDLPSTKL